MYAKARKGIIPNFTGVSAPYEPPGIPDVEVRTADETIEASLHKIVKVVEPIIKPEKQTSFL